MTKEELLRRVILQLKEDIKMGEHEAIEELLKCLSDVALKGYLPEFCGDYES